MLDSLAGMLRKDEKERKRGWEDGQVVMWLTLSPWLCLSVGFLKCSIPCHALCPEVNLFDQGLCFEDCHNIKIQTVPCIQVITKYPPSPPAYPPDLHHWIKFSYFAHPLKRRKTHTHTKRYTETEQARSLYILLGYILCIHFVYKCQ